MNDWKQKIEKQIVVTNGRGDYINQHSSVDSNMHYESAETMRLLLDVAVAADEVVNGADINTLSAGQVYVDEGSLTALVVQLKAMEGGE